GVAGSYAAEREAARRRADAVGLLAERALAAGFGGHAAPRGAERENEGNGGRDGSGETSEAESGCACGSPTPEVPLSGTRAARYQVILHVDSDTLSAKGEPGRSELEDGTRVSAETSRRLACDASLIRLTHGTDGSVLDVGRKTRTIPPALRRALEVRDRGCRFPGCGLRFTEGHHVVHWADGGETSLANALLLCRHHHGLLHEGGWEVHWWSEGRPLFHDPRGIVHFDGGWRPPPLGGDPVAALVRENRRRGADPDPYTAGARWKRERDIPDEVYFRATEAAL
ncbi:MAG TPA: DUF222 domain-containing protein, partial [Longimicrobiales bacterium]|nr:DUF222 domain-containing protein [Longimicrobiales bacterium]